MLASLFLTIILASTTAFAHNDDRECEIGHVGGTMSDVFFRVKFNGHVMSQPEIFANAVRSKPEETKRRCATLAKRVRDFNCYLAPESMAVVEADILRGLRTYNARFNDANDQIRACEYILTRTETAVKAEIGHQRDAAPRNRNASEDQDTDPAARPAT